MASQLQAWQADILIKRVNRDAKQDPNLARDLLWWMLVRSQESKVASSMRRKKGRRA